MQLSTNIIKNTLDESYREDFGINGDITSEAVIDEAIEIDFKISAREDIILCGANIAEYFFNKTNIHYQLHKKDSNEVSAGNVIISGHGNARDILRLERVILNYLQNLSGVATLTNKYVQQIKGTKTKIYDTRKTIPNLRRLQKYAVRCGGGYNHRSSLDSSILIKDNHIAICGGVAKALKKAKLVKQHYSNIEIECDLISQVKEAVEEGVNIIMLDNMTLDKIIEAIKIIDKRSIVEVSGGVNLENISAIAAAGVDIISVGKLTHSARSVDIGLDI